LKSAVRFSKKNHQILLKYWTDHNPADINVQMKMESGMLLYLTLVYLFHTVAMAKQERHRNDISYDGSSRPQFVGDLKILQLPLAERPLFLATFKTWCLSRLVGYGQIPKQFYLCIILLSLTIQESHFRVILLQRLIFTLATYKRRTEDNTCVR